MGNVETATPGPSGTSMSFMGRFVGVFISPGETFADIARKPDFIAPLVVSIAASIALVETMLWKIGAEQIVRNSLQMSGRAASMPPEQLEQVVQRGGTFTAIIMHVSGLIGAPIFLLIVTGIGLLILNPILGSQVGLKPVFSATCYASLVRLIGVVMGIPMIFMGDPEHFNAENPVPTNLGFFLDPASVSKGIVAFATGFDFLALWFLIVLAIGLSQLTGGKAKARTIFLLYFAIWMILVLGRAALAALF